jgi:acetolactate synthase-1/2/3 large subunit
MTHSAKLDSIPLIAITGQVPRKLMGSDAFQEVDTYGLMLPITKHNWRGRMNCFDLTVQ